MESRINLVTLGVSNIKIARAFYEKMGWKASSASNENIIFLHGRGFALALFGWHELAKDAGVKSTEGGFRGVTLAQNVHAKEEVALLLKEAEAAGGKIMKPAQDVFWGGHSGYFADPDDHLWEVAWNPFFKLNDRGEMELPV